MNYTKEYNLFLPWKSEENDSIFREIANENLFHLNPHWIISHLSFEEDSYRIEVRNHATDKESSFRGKVITSTDDALTITAEEKIWGKIRFFEKESSLFAEITYTQEIEEENERFLVLWLQSIKQYLRLYLTTSLNTRFFRFLMNKIILKMNPSQRKISLMLIRLTIVEIIVILIILIGWLLLFR